MKRIDENHSFNINVCQVLKGHIQKAILLKEIYGWCLINNSKKHNIKFGLPWTYMSSAGFALKFPYMNAKSISRWIRELEQEGWIYSAVLNKKAYDRTKWFTINFDRYDIAVLKKEHSISQIEKWTTQIEKCTSQIGQPIPPSTTTLKTSTSTNIVCIKEKDTQIQNLKNELSLLKKEKEERKKLAAKKERSFPDVKAAKQYDKRDKRKNKMLPFDIVSARKTIDILFPTWKDLDKQYKEVFTEPASEEIYKKCLKTFVENGIGSYYSSIRTIDKLIVKLLEWTKQEVKFQHNNTFKSTKQPQINQFIMKEEDCMLHKNTWLNE